MAYSGKYTPINPSKYLGDPTTITFRSLWERRVMVHLDTNSSVVGWSSEEVVIPYISPVDNKPHRYFVDFFVQTKDGKCFLLEVKPHKESIEPQVKSKKTRSYIKEVCTYAVNQAKWKSAQEYCEDRGWKFKLITENELFGGKK